MYVKKYIKSNYKIDFKVDFLNDYVNFKQVQNFSRVEVVGDNKEGLKAYLNADCLFIVWVTSKNQKYIIPTNKFYIKRDKKAQTLYDLINLKKGKYKYRPKV